MRMFATEARSTSLPKAHPTPPAVFSVPRGEGGFDYYESPAGSTPVWNADWPKPNVKHPNGVGVAAVHIGRDLPRGARKVGSGHVAIGSVTAMPGAGGTLPGIEALGARSLSAGSSGVGFVDTSELWENAMWWALPLAAAAVATIVVVGRRKP